MKTQDGIALIEVELMRFAVLDKSIQLNRFASILDGPVMDATKKIFSDALRAQFGINDDIVDLQLFAGIKAHRDPTI